MEISYKIEKIQKNFSSLILLNQKIENEKSKLKMKLKNLKDTHAKMSKSNNKQIFLFCLDSFYFQYKIFSMELDNLEKFDDLIKNRTYCDYYKLYKLILKYINENNDELEIEVNHSLVPVYKDLEPFFDYGVENIKLVHENMLDCIKSMFDTVLKKEEVINEYTTKKKAGYSISNFINTLTHENNVLKAQLDLYLNYISFFHISQQKQIKRLFDSYINFEKEVDNNISSEHAFSFDDLIEDDIFFGEQVESKVDEEHPEENKKTKNEKKKEETGTGTEKKKEIDKIPTKENNSVDKSVKKDDKNQLVKDNKKELPEFKGLE
jgi:hypothetical protein